MFDDILGKGKEKIEEDKDSIIEALKDNVEQKEKLIQDLTKQIVQLERALEAEKTETHAGI